MHISFMKDLFFVLPEITIGLTACLLVLYGAFCKPCLTLSRLISYLGLSVCFVLLLLTIPAVSNKTTLFIFYNSAIISNFGIALKALLLIVVTCTLIYSKNIHAVTKLIEPEYSALVLFSTLGMFVLISAQSFVTVFLGMELLSLPIYGLVALNRESRLSVESALKYFILGAVGSAIFLYGVSCIFGTTHALEFTKIQTMLHVLPKEYYLLTTIGLVCLLVAIAFKLGAAPVHFWVPDVYAGTPYSIILFISTAPKIALFALLIKMLLSVFSSFFVVMQQMLLFFALVSLAWGSFAGLVQTEIKRLLAYSSIAHMGYILLALVIGTPEAVKIALAYLSIYVFSVTATVGILGFLESKGHPLTLLKDFSGLSKIRPGFSFLLLLLFFSMSGIPPLAGFIVKMQLLSLLIAAGHVFLALCAILFSIISIYYYLRPIKIMYFESPETQPVPSEVKGNHIIHFFLSSNALLTLFLGLFPHALFLYTRFAFS